MRTPRYGIRALLLLTAFCATVTWVYLQFSRDDIVLKVDVVSLIQLYFAGDRYTLEQFAEALDRERRLIELNPIISKDDVTVSITAHRNVQESELKKLFRTCSDVGFERFTIRSADFTANLVGRLE